MREDKEKTTKYCAFCLSEYMDPSYIEFDHPLD
jgi:hypothetical protein